MAFKTKKEKYAYVKGIKKGMRGGRPYGKKKKPRERSSKTKPGNPFGMTYYQMLREGEAQKRSLMGDDFERDSRGRIKDHYTVDGFFEPN
ncbi:MAG: hypothetical protein E7624_08640 [Ruminococcaceae bacterium]|nr:hypothetical protein [Oscillospiraceae bacterium]